MESSPGKHILITNDDGIDAYGLGVLVENVSALPGMRVTVVAPSAQQSATSHSLTLTAPLRVIRRGRGRYAVTGTPTDAVLMALEQILADDPPDVVLSGINHGPNMGEDVLYSGTVAAAMEGALFHKPSFALSLASWHPRDFSGAAAFVRRFLPRLLEQPLPPGTLLNINIPDGPEDALKGVKVAKLGSRVYHDVITDHVDPRGRPYYWIGGRGPTWEEAPDTDYTALSAGYVAVTPLMIDITDYKLLAEMSKFETDGLPGQPIAEPDRYRPSGDVGEADGPDDPRGPGVPRDARDPGRGGRDPGAAGDEWTGES
ncbi:MAG: 5'/3'-nucleotidase SurE [Candidatus Krumholzibacteriia bacterium]